MIWIIAPQMYGGFGSFDMGLVRMDLSSISRALEDAGYGALPSGFLTLGGSGYGVRGRIILGGGGYSMVERAIPYRDRVFSISAGAGFFEAGYMLTKLGPLYIFPMLSVGGGGISLTISDTAGVSFQDALRGQMRQIHLEGGGLSAGARITALLFIGKLLLTVSAGYTYSPPFYLRSPYLEVSGAPKASISGFHISIGLGGGYVQEYEGWTEEK